MTYSNEFGIDPAEFPSRGTALAIVAALNDPQTVDLKDAARRCGLDYFSVNRVADLCWRVYGFPELEPGAFWAA